MTIKLSEMNTNMKIMDLTHTLAGRCFIVDDDEEGHLWVVRLPDSDIHIVMRGSPSNMARYWVARWPDVEGSQHVHHAGRRDTDIMDVAEVIATEG